MNQSLPALDLSAPARTVDPRLLHGIELFNRGEYFECHEVLEEAWTPERGERRLFLQSLIHMAVGCYHHTRGNPIGATRQLRKGLRKLAGYLPHCEGVDTLRLEREVQVVLQAIETGAPVAEYPRMHMRHARAAL